MREPQARPAPSTSSTPYTQRFRRSANAVLLTPEQRRRQATVMALAWKAFGSRERTMTFFNEPCDAIGGRPIDLAINSDAGLTAVSALLDALAAGPSVKERPIV